MDGPPNIRSLLPRLSAEFPGVECVKVFKKVNKFQLLVPRRFGCKRDGIAIWYPTGAFFAEM